MVRAGETIGLVEQLSWRAIKVRTMEGNSLLIPNTVASRDRLEVFRRGGVPMARTMKIGLEYDLAPARARAALEAAAADVQGVAALPAPASYLVRFHDYAVDYELRYWLEDYAHYLDVDSRVRERVWYRLEREGIPIAYPAHPAAPVCGRAASAPQRRRHGHRRRRSGTARSSRPCPTRSGASSPEEPVASDLPKARSSSARATRARPCS